MNTELNFPRRLLAGLTALALLLMLALPVWAEGEETEKLPVSINSVEDLSFMYGESEDCTSTMALKR